MRYVVLETTEDTVTIWDGKAMDPDHPGVPAGQMTLEMRFHGCRKDDLVELHLRIVSTGPLTDAEQIDQKLAQGAGKRLGS